MYKGQGDGGEGDMDENGEGEGREEGEWRKRGEGGREEIRGKGKIYKGAREWGNGE